MQVEKARNMSGSDEIMSSDQINAFNAHYSSSNDQCNQSSLLRNIALHNKHLA